MRISDWSSDVCSSDLTGERHVESEPGGGGIVGDRVDQHRPADRPVARGEGEIVDKVGIGEDIEVAIAGLRQHRAAARTGNQRFEIVARNRLDIAGQPGGEAVPGKPRWHLLRLGRSSLDRDLSEMRGRQHRDRRAGRETDTDPTRSEEHTSELQSLMRNSYAVFCLTNKKPTKASTT